MSRRLSARSGHVCLNRFALAHACDCCDRRTLIMPMTSDAKVDLSTAIRSLRVRLLDDLHDATETAYRLSIRARDAGLNEAARVRRGRMEVWVAEQMRSQGVSKATATRTADDFRRQAHTHPPSTLLHPLLLPLL